MLPFAVVIEALRVNQCVMFISSLGWELRENFEAGIDTLLGEITLSKLFLSPF